MTVLSWRALNRALLARNLLLERSTRPVTAAVEHLVGLQAQEPQEPYVGLFARLADFDPAEPSRLLERRELVRTLLMRRTMHLVSAADCLALRALHQPMLAQRSRSVLRSRLVGVDEAELAAAGYPLFDAEPRLLTEVGPGGAASAGRTPPRATSATRSARWSRWCRSRHAGCGGRPGRPATPRSRAGSAASSRPPPTPTSWCCATWPRSARPRAPTSGPGPG